MLICIHSSIDIHYILVAQHMYLGIYGENLTFLMNLRQYQRQLQHRLLRHLVQLHHQRQVGGTHGNSYNNIHGNDYVVSHSLVTAAL